MAYRLTTGTATHVGAVRRLNEDSVHGSAQQGLWVVADGMGGHSHGDWAATQVTSRLAATPLSGAIDDRGEQVADALELVNDSIFEAGTKAGLVIGSTVVMLLIAGDGFSCLWSGDSRAYLLRQAALKRLSRDHSHVEQLVAAGALTPEQAANHPMANVITRAVGVSAELALDVLSGEVRDNDVFLLCSDGLTRCLSDPEIAQTLLAAPPQAACDSLVARCLQRGAPDNVTVAVVGCEQLTIAV